MSLLMDTELGKLNPVASESTSAGMTSSAFHRVQTSVVAAATGSTNLKPVISQPASNLFSAPSEFTINQGSGRDPSPDIRTEEDEVDSPTPSSTASESRSPSAGANLQEQQHSNRNVHRRHGDSDAKGDAINREDAFAWPSHSTCDEQRQLLGTEEESSDGRASSDEYFLLDDDEGGHRNADAKSNKSVWAITKEQLNYYTTQFFSMQPNPNAIIPGAQAKEFFEKSRLPINELRTIWQLADVSKDGGLSLEEFLTAMHLVVLRRNDIELPEALPDCLCPHFFNRKLHSKLRGRMTADSNGRERNHSLKNDNAITEEKNSEGGETTSMASLISSPGRDGPKPVNFDFSRSDVRRDPHIVQPVALRLSDSPIDHRGHEQSSDLEDTEEEAKRAEQLRRPSGQRQAKGEVLYQQLWTTKDDEDEDSVDGCIGSEASIRALRKQPSDHYGPFSLPPQHLKQPPPPPPRSTKSSHARSSSLDLNRYDNVQHRISAKLPPAVPPRQHNESPGNSTQSEQMDEHNSPSPRASTGLAAIAFHRQSRGLNLRRTTDVSELSRNTKSLQISIHEYSERNSVIARTINELHQEVSDTLEERIALEYQLEQLKSFGE